MKKLPPGFRSDDFKIYCTNFMRGVVEVFFIFSPKHHCYLHKDGDFESWCGRTNFFVSHEEASEFLNCVFLDENELLTDEDFKI